MNKLKRKNRKIENIKIGKNLKNDKSRRGKIGKHEKSG